VEGFGEFAGRKFRFGISDPGARTNMGPRAYAVRGGSKYMVCTHTYTRTYALVLRRQFPFPLGFFIYFCHYFQN
jgi:hypothetical protein